MNSQQVSNHLLNTLNIAPETVNTIRVLPVVERMTDNGDMTKEVLNAVAINYILTLHDLPQDIIKLLRFKGE